MAGVKEASLQNSEIVEDVTGLGDAAIYYGFFGRSNDSVRSKNGITFS